MLDRTEVARTWQIMREAGKPVLPDPLRKWVGYVMGWAMWSILVGVVTSSVIAGIVTGISLMGLYVLIAGVHVLMERKWDKAEAMWTQARKEARLASYDAISAECGALMRDFHKILDMPDGPEKAQALRMHVKAVNQLSEDNKS